MIVELFKRIYIILNYFLPSYTAVKNDVKTKLSLIKLPYLMLSLLNTFLICQYWKYICVEKG